MTQDKNKPHSELPGSKRDRPDPAFKAVTKDFATQLGLETVETEFPQTLRADLILAVPQGLALENTLFSFFRRFNIIEFKGEDDQFDEEGFVRNEVRTGLLYLYNRDANFENMLNLIVSSRLPQRFFDYMEAHQCKFESQQAQPWLWRGRVGLQEVAVVVCRELPLEPRYYQWLLFAPATSRKWREFVKMLAREGNTSMLEVVRNLRPKEYEFMTVDIQELLKEYTPEERKRYIKDWLSAFASELPAMAEEMPEDLSQTIAKIKPELRVAGMNLEERLAGLTPEQRRELLKLLVSEEKKAE